MKNLESAIAQAERIERMLVEHQASANERCARMMEAFDKLEESLEEAKRNVRKHLWGAE